MGAAVVAVSGGVDSLASLALLQIAGWQTTAVHCLFHEAAQIPPGLLEICKKMGVTLQILDLRKEFREGVIEPYVDGLRSGITPNPCVICNSAIKFGIFRERLAGTLATGHYTCVVRGEQGEVMLRKGRDGKKDQSYFLSLVPPDKLADVAFPLGQWEKAEVKKFMAKRNLLPPLARESQDICFLRDRHAFLERHLGTRRGRFVLVEGQKIAGEHEGYWHYTAGQRRGLGIPWREPLYVVGRDGDDVLVGPRAKASLIGVCLEECNFYLPVNLWPQKLYGKVGYNRKLAPCTVEYDGATLKMDFAMPQLVVSPGQIGAIYDDAGTVLCGGIISAVKLAESFDNM